MARASDTVRLKLEDDIAAGRLRPGDTIDEKSLAEAFGVSRTPAREAIAQLAAAELVEIRPRHGAVVRGVSAAEAVAMVETLALLEAEAAALAATRMSPEETAALARLHGEAAPLASRDDSPGYIDANSRFHAAIHAGARNDYLAGLIRQTRSRMAFYHASSLDQRVRRDSSVREHAAVVAALAAGDPAAARQAMLDHILAGGRVYADIVAALQPRRPPQEDGTAEPGAKGGRSARP